MSTRKCENCQRENVAKYGFEYCQYCHKPIGRNKDKDIKRLSQIESELRELRIQLEALDKVIWQIEQNIGESADKRRAKALEVHNKIIDLEHEKQHLRDFWKL